jgi:hypothetical protein
MWEDVKIGYHYMLEQVGHLSGVPRHGGQQISRCNVAYLSTPKIIAILQLAIRVSVHVCMCVYVCVHVCICVRVCIRLRKSCNTSNLLSPPVKTWCPRTNMESTWPLWGRNTCYRIYFITPQLTIALTYIYTCSQAYIHTYRWFTRILEQLHVCWESKISTPATERSCAYRHRLRTYWLRDTNTSSLLQHGSTILQSRGHTAI